MNKTPKKGEKRRSTEGEVGELVEVHRTPEYQQERADQLIGQAGADQRIRAERAAKVDWSEAPNWATSYRVRDDGANTRCSWLGNTGEHVPAPGYFDVGIGQVEIIQKSECVEPAPGPSRYWKNNLDERAELPPPTSGTIIDGKLVDDRPTRLRFLITHHDNLADQYRVALRALTS